MAKKDKKSKKGAEKKGAKGGGKKGAKKSVKKGASLEPKPVKIGKGAPVSEIANDFVSMFNARAGDQAIWDKWFSKKLVSIEGFGQQWEGMKAVKAKSDWWNANNTVHSCACQGPYVGATGFAVKFIVDVECKADGKRQTMEEIAVYRVHNGKVVEEEFMGHCSGA